MRKISLPAAPEPPPHTVRSENEGDNPPILICDLDKSQDRFGFGLSEQDSEICFEESTFTV
jgi:hypothetical protein